MSQSASRYGGRPIIAIRATYENEDGVQCLAVTSAEKGFDRDGVSYIPEAISLGSIKASAAPSDNAISIEMARDGIIAAFVHPVMPPLSIEMEIDGMDLDEFGDVQEVRHLFAGSLISVSSSGGGIVELHAEPLTGRVRRRALPRSYSHICPHVLYGSACGAMRAANSTETVVDAVTTRGLDPDSWAVGNTVAFTLPELPDSRAVVGGVLEWKAGGVAQVASILSFTALDVLGGHQIKAVLRQPPQGLEAGDAITFVKGCPRSIEGCREIFGNVQNFGGFPWVPFENPIGKSMVG